MVGGGRNAFIGAVHRLAMRLDDQIELVAGALSSDPENAAASAAEIGIAPERSYADYRAWRKREAARPDGIEAVVIVTPNHLHAPVATAFLEAGIDVICDKPLSTTLDDARSAGGACARRGGAASSSRSTTPATPWSARRARWSRPASSAHRVVHGAYIQDWLAKPIDAEGQKQAEWRTDPARAGQSAVLADIGVHAFNLASFISGCEAEAVVGRPVHRRARRRLDDNAHVLVRWTGGARGTILASQTSPGHYNDLSVRIYGDKAGLEWSGGRPEELRFSPYGEETPHAGARRPWLDRRGRPGVAHAGSASGRLYRGLRQFLPRRSRYHPRASLRRGWSIRHRAAQVPDVVRRRRAA